MSAFSLSNLTCFAFGVGGVTVGNSPDEDFASSAAACATESRFGVSKAAFLDSFMGADVPLAVVVVLGDADDDAVMLS